MARSKSARSSSVSSVLSVVTSLLHVSQIGKRAGLFVPGILRMLTESWTGQSQTTAGAACAFTKQEPTKSSMLVKMCRMDVSA